MTKGREIIIFAKSQPPFDVHRQYLDVSLLYLQARFRGLAVEFFTVLLISRPSSSITIGFIFKKLSAHDFLAFRKFENKLFELDFSIFQKPCLYGQTPLRR